MNVRDVYEASRPVIEQFGTDPVKGLTDERVVRNRQHYGGNRLTPPAKDPLWKQYLEKFTDPTIIILCVCAVLAIGIGLYRKEIPWDGIAILVAICIATAGGTWSEYKANKAFELLKKDSDNIPVKVTRNGEFHTITSGDLVAGDLIHLEGGDRIPADGVLLQSIDLMIDESLMTGESVPVNRSAASPRVTGGTFAVVGNGVAVVTAVGDKTELGNLASALGDRFVCQDPTHHKVYRDEGQCEVCGQELQKEEEGQTPLQEKLSELAGQISAVGTYAAILIFLALLGSAVFREDFGVLSAAWRTCLLAVIGVEALVVAAYMATRRKMPPKLLLWQAIIVTCGSLLAAAVVCAGSGDWLVPVRRVLDFFMVAVTIVVVAVPEGLPMAVTIVLAASMRKIRQDNNLVRKMLATETIGAMTVICSDKTGTLTKNQMEVQQVFLHGKLLQGEALKGSKASHAFDLLSLACAVNSTAEIEHVDGRVKFVGNPTEGAMLAWLETLGINYTELRGKMPIHSRLCFSTERKMMTSLSGNDQCAQCLTCPMDGVSAELTSVAGRKDGCRITFTKGAPDKVLPLCDTVLFDKDTRPASQSVSEVLAVTEAMASKCVRPLAIAYRVQHRDQVQGASASGNEMEKGLTLLAIVGLSDPVREDVPGAMKACDAAGIEVKMVTGDHTATARAIAAEIGLLKGSDDLVLTGEQFAVMSDEAAAAIAPRLRVLSRSRPLDKERLVKLLQDQGHVVGVTGDGTNDAPALKKADVGIAMGLRGTEVAKEASDIVLTDDDFGSIVRAVHWGRTLYENLQKFLQFQLTVNVSALTVAFLSPILATVYPGVFSTKPLTVLQLLWINLVMDTLAALAFGLEPPRPETMLMKPRPRKEPFLTPTMLVNVLVLGGFFSILVLALQATDLLGAAQYGPAVAASAIFTSYVFLQVFNMFNARSTRPGCSALKGISKSRSFFYVMGLVVVVQVLLTEFGSNFMQTAPLPLAVWGRILLFAASGIVVGEAVRIVQRAGMKGASMVPQCA